MKKALAILITVCIIASLFVSCDNTTKLDELVSTRFDAAESRSLIVSNENFIDFNDSSIKWQYKAAKDENSDPLYNVGAAAVWTDIPGTPSGRLSNTIEFSQGKWDFELRAVKTNNDNSEVVIYYGKTEAPVLLQKQTSTDPQRIVINLTAQLSGQKGYIVLSEIGIKHNAEDESTFDIPSEIKIDNSPLSLSDDTIISISDNTISTVSGIEIGVGTHTITVKKTGANGEILAEESKTFGVYAGRTTTISNWIIEITQAGKFETEDDFEDELKQGVTISGIAGVADFYDTIQEAYEAVKAMLVENSGLVEQPLSAEAFNAFFTDGGRITWTIYGNQEVTDTRMFSFGRAANRFGERLHITEINIVGGNSSASLDLSAVNGTFALPYNWWNVEDSVNTTLKCKDIIFYGIKSMPSAIYQCTLYPTTYEFDGCTFNGNLYSYQNFDVAMTIKNCTFNAPANTQYAFFAQGTGGTITLDNNVFNNYTRGINLQRPTADFIVTNNTIVSTVSEPDRGAIQLTDGKSFVVNGNKVDVNAGNAFWFHNAASNANVTYTISNNDIKAPYIGYSGVTAFDVNTKITSSDNTLNITYDGMCMKKGATVAEETNLTAIH